MFRRTIKLKSSSREELIDITEPVCSLVKESGIESGMIFLYARGATAAVMIQENWDESVPLDMIDLLRKIAPRGVWRHDLQDGNADSHLKAGLIGPSESIPLIAARPGLSRWQGIFFCEFDGPRREREVVCTIIGE